MRSPRSYGRWVVPALAAVLAAVCGWFGASVDERLSPGGIVPATTEAARADRALQEGFGAAPPHLVLVTRTVDGAASVEERAVAAQGRRLARQLSADRSVAKVVSYWQTKAPSLRSADGRSALVLVRLHGREQEATRAAERLMPQLVGRHGPVDVQITGEAASRAEAMRLAKQDQIRAEVLALPLTALLLLMAFGSVVAALLPVAVGVLAVLGSLAALRLLTLVTEVSVSASNISSALGFALAVDYSLFLLARYREERAAGAAADAALRTALRTAGRAVLFSAGTVILSLASLLVFPHTVLRSIAYGGIAVTAFAALASLTVVPALLKILGHRITRPGVLARRRIARPGVVAGHRITRPGVLARRRLRLRGTPGAVRTDRLGGWGRAAVLAQRRPYLVAVGVTVVLLVLASPLTRLQIGLFDDRVQPATSTVAKAGALLRGEFRPGAVIAPTTVVLPRFDPSKRAAALDTYARSISRQRGVERVETATGSYARGNRTPLPDTPASSFTSAHGVQLAVATPGEPYSTANRDLARTLRRLPAPGPGVLVGGPGAALHDVQHTLVARLPWCLLLAGTALFALTLALTRRPVMALKALLLNALSLTASFGALVFVFQEGHLGGLVGEFPVTGSTDVLMPALIFGIAFGLSMDYEILLLSRICEEYERHPDPAAAVAHGLDRTARLFTWAALILAVVMAALATSDLVMLKIIGVGLALAVLLDATVVRGLLTPSLLALAGRTTWWSPWPGRTAPAPQPPPGTRPLAGLTGPHPSRSASS